MNDVKSSKAQGNVFIIDDAVDSCALMGSILASSGYKVVTSTDPVAAFQKKLPFRPDILLLDIMMPGMSGVEVMEKIGHSGQRSSFRIIAVSGLSDQNDIDQAFAAGANDFLAKPFRPHELLLRVEKQMEELRKDKGEAGENIIQNKIDNLAPKSPQIEFERRGPSVRSRLVAPSSLSETGHGPRGFLVGLGGASN